MELQVNVVEVREIGTTLAGEVPVHWRLLTNYPVVTARDIDAIRKDMRIVG